MGLGLFLALHLVSLFAVVMWLRRLVLRRLRPERLLSDLRNEVQVLVAEINQAGDQQVQLIEDRSQQAVELRQRLTALIDAAREQVLTLEQGLAAAAPTPHPTARIDDAVKRETGSPRPAGTSADVQSNAPNEASPSDEPQINLDVAHLDPREAVQVLATAGLSSDIIAMHTGMAKGEVELIVSLARSGAHGTP